MPGMNNIRREYESALSRKLELSESLRQAERTEPNNFNRIWQLRDQVAYWEGKSEGLKFALDELDR